MLDPSREVNASSQRGCLKSRDLYLCFLCVPIAIGSTEGHGELIRQHPKILIYNKLLPLLTPGERGRRHSRQPKESEN